MADSTTEVLIVGAGPAGLMAGMYLAEMGIPYRIIDKRGTRTLNGRADGFHIRTLEIWDSFGIAEKTIKAGVPLGQFATWHPDPEDPGKGIVRNREVMHGVAQTRAAMEAESGKLPEPMAIHQGFIEAAMIEASRVRGGSKVERSTVPVSIDVQDDISLGYPVSVKVQHLPRSELAPPYTGAHCIGEDGKLKPERGFIDAFGEDPDEIVPSICGKQGTTETIRCKYIIGADGARSWVRNSIGLEMEGEDHDVIWGAIDIKPLTDFPDIRKTTPIFSRYGSGLLIPRELGLIRVYVQLPDDYIHKKGYQSEYAAADIMQTANKILAPYTIDYKYCDWFTVYPVAQKLCPSYSSRNRIFLAGDACHSHSPKGGQGQNVSQQDAYNLAFKLAAVIRGQMPSSILSTYESERLPVAHELIDLDRFQGKVMDSREDKAPEDIKTMIDRMLTQSGVGVCYGPSALIACSDQTNQQAAKKLKLGMRVPPACVYKQSNGMPVGVQSLMTSNGLWRLLVFAGDVTKPEQLAKVNSLNDDLLGLQSRYLSASAKRSRSFIEVLTIHSASVNEIESAEFSSAFFPYDPVSGHDYETIFGDCIGDMSSSVNSAHATYGVDASQGAIALVRPDQVVAWVGYLTDADAMHEWLASLMIPRSTSSSSFQARL